MAYRLAEDPNVLLPAIVNMDGFYLSFTREPVSIPPMEQVRRFLPGFTPHHAQFRASEPMAQGVAVLGGALYTHFRHQMHLAAQNALAVHTAASEEFADIFGRNYDLVEGDHLDDAEFVLVMAGSFATKARAAIQVLREEGKRVGLLRLRLIRPWPADAIGAALAGRRGVAVIDQNLAPGLGGILFQEIAATLLGRPDPPRVVRSFVGGLGGKDISLAEFRHVVDRLEHAQPGDICGGSELLFTESDWRQVQPLLKVAGQEVTA
jgi:pyruvate ferredoxin oxidoreductase alpha subunit